MRLARLTLGVLLAVSAVAAPGVARAWPPKAAVLTGHDTLVPSGVPATLRFKVERDTYSKYDLKGLTIEFRANGSLLGTAVSDYRGYAAFTLDVPPSSGDLVVTGRLSSSSYSAPDETLLVSVRPKLGRVVVTDIDKTISNARWSDVTSKSNQYLYPVRGAVAALNDIAKDATILYLTAREDRYRAKTKDWLQRWGFPRGPLICSDDDLGSGDPAIQKTKSLRAVVPYFPNMKWGFGNKNSDARAYSANGLATFLFDTEDAGPYYDYAFVTDDWTVLRALNAAGQVPGLSWATSFR